ncbi:kinase [Burkholderia oklahomensis]|uniref:GHMP family kinase ATP-binding protein n=1 Tax=Burkholderia oklahomensis TaxID=342113 RepID=UPI0005D8A78E|nr:kinase [Burkholderia oklahomensis]AJX33255.1 elongation factor Tu GTP binding domain protein [Burkholderia oklahomensis C6786]AOI45568.1 kinase [Burkholderia oklahomensis C6786]MBI0358330.1 kinase [Burkholderia oklahomensis]SUW56335.1 Sulfate adenylyltransferase subunit 1 [Burkholderia oklahomensis]
MSIIDNNEDLGVLRFITAGSVDDGKSTLIGRLLYDSKAVLSDQLSALSRAKNKRTVGDELDLAPGRHEDAAPDLDAIARARAADRLSADADGNAGRNAERPFAKPGRPPPGRAHSPARRLFSVGNAPATFGELVQGREPVSGDDFLITLPITLTSTARFCRFRHSDRLYVFPASKRKSLKAATLFFDRFGIRTGGVLQICSDVSEGKGLASSSSDIVATLRALAVCFEIPLSPDDMCAIIREIEPTDGVMFDESVAFFHRRVELGKVMGKLPKICILAIDEGGTIDTVEYNGHRFEFSRDEADQYAALLADVDAAISRSDVRQIGRAATLSAQMHQKRNPKRTLRQLEALMREVGADGIVNCHSGTFIGLCFDASHPDALDTIAHAERTLRDALRQPISRFFTR